MYPDKMETKAGLQWQRERQERESNKQSLREGPDTQDGKVKLDLDLWPRPLPVLQYLLPPSARARRHCLHLSSEFGNFPKVAQPLTNHRQGSDLITFCRCNHYVCGFGLTHSQGLGWQSALCCVCHFPPSLSVICVPLGTTSPKVLLMISHQPLLMATLCLSCLLQATAASQHLSFCP